MNNSQSFLKTMTTQMKSITLPLIAFLFFGLSLIANGQNSLSNQGHLISSLDKHSTNNTVKNTADSDSGDIKEPENSGQPGSPALVPTCAGVQSPSNPYPCCNTSGNAVSSSLGTGLGNCTFGAWYHAQRFWGVQLPPWGNANTWFSSAQSASLPTSPTPALYSIGVSSTLSTYGHVGWIMEIRDNDVLVYEQLCGSGAQGITQTWRPVSTFNKGFILSPVSAPSPTLTQATYGPILHGSQTQTIAFNQTNVNPGMRVVVIFPNGGRATLKDAQLNLNGGTLTTYVTLGTAGTYQFQVFNENGKYSGMTNVSVN